MLNGINTAYPAWPIEATGITALSKNTQFLNTNAWPRSSLAFRAPTSRRKLKQALCSVSHLQHIYMAGDEAFRGNFRAI